MSSIDGRKVNFRGRTSWVGLVQGDSGQEGQVRVAWTHPRQQTGIHKVTDLVVIDSPPSQDELKKMYYG
jgi:hypothetical protein